jgi:cleavage and polyadenylation specificity factor subunit 2
MSNVLFKKLGDYELAWIDGEVGMEEEMLPLLPLSTDPPPHKAVLVGDLRLADFKQLLASKGVQAEFVGGQLRCGDYITVRKVGDSSQKSGVQQVVIEGPLSEEYYKIREYLYSQFYAL